MHETTGIFDQQARFEKCAPMVKRMAHHLAARLPASVQLSDIMQAGLIGLMDAINRYKDDQGAHVETYAAQRIRGAMLDELRTQDWFPRSSRKMQREIDMALAAAGQKLGRLPNEREVAQELGVSLYEYQRMLGDKHSFQLVFFEDQHRDVDDSGPFDRTGPVDEIDPLAMLSDARFRAALVTHIESLPEREKQLMGMYYEQELNFKEIAEVVGITESRVCQLHSQAAARLRTGLRDWADEGKGKAAKPAPRVKKAAPARAAAEAAR